MAEALKAQGNASFKEGRYDQAVGYFTSAIDLDGTNAVLFSNRSGAHASLGHFDTLNHHHLSFYKVDYLLARSLIEFPIVKGESDLGDKVSSSNKLPAEKEKLCSLFIHSKVHFLTAPEPSLRLRYEEIFCDQEIMSELEMGSCFVRRMRSFGRRSQLAEMVMNREQ